jgi:osmoprotectant transport system substrate-binding protein
MKIKQLMSLVLGMTLLCAVTACSGKASTSAPVASDSNGAASDKPIRVGSKDFTENLVVAEIYALALEGAGYKVERKLDIAGSVVHTSIMNDEIDLYPEYTGTGLLTILKLPMMTDPQQV